MKQKVHPESLTPEILEDFLVSLKRRGLSDNTTRAYSADIRELMKAKGAEIPIEDLEDVFIDWLSETRDSTSPKTTGRRITSLRCFARWSGLGVIVTDYKAPKPAPAEPHPLPGGIADVMSMIDAVDKDQHKALIALCGLAGHRYMFPLR